MSGYDDLWMLSPKELPWIHRPWRRWLHDRLPIMMDRAERRFSLYWFVNKVIDLDWLYDKAIGGHRHEVDKNNFGYGGGDMMDAECSLCGYQFQIPVRESEQGTFLQRMYEEFNGNTDPWDPWA